MAFAYFNLVLCLAEMTSTLPFSGKRSLIFNASALMISRSSHRICIVLGGSYGFVRVAVGPFPGFLVGYCESILNILYVTSAVYYLGNILTFITGLHPDYEPIYWAMFFASSLYINAKGGSLFWNVNAVLAIMSAVILLLYVLGTASFIDYDKNVIPYLDTLTDEDRTTSMFRFLPWTSWFFVGIELLPLTCRECEEVSALYCLSPAIFSS